MTSQRVHYEHVGEAITLTPPIWCSDETKQKQAHNFGCDEHGLKKDDTVFSTKNKTFKRQPQMNMTWLYLTTTTIPVVNAPSKSRRDCMDGIKFYFL